MSDPFEFRDPVAPVPAQVPERPSLGRTVWRVMLGAALGVGVAALGTATHRTLWNDLPVGLVIALALTASTALVCRAWSGLGVLAAAAVGWIVAVQVFSASGAGGDVLLTDPAAAIPSAWASIVWSWGGVALMGVVVFLPRRWFARR